MKSSKKQKINKLGFALAIIVLLSLCFYYAYKAYSPATKSESVKKNTDTYAIDPPNSSDIIIGNKNAPVKILFYTDYECPFCHDVDARIPYWLSKFGENNIAFYFRNLPLTEIHPKALEFAKDVECVHRLYNDTDAYNIGIYLYNNKESKLSDLEKKYSETIANFNLDSFTLCRNDPQIVSFIEKSAYIAIANEITHTPSIFIYDSTESSFVFKTIGGGVGIYDRILDAYMTHFQNKKH